MKIISSLSNLIIKKLIKLKKAAVRKKQNLIIVDGRREISSALKNNWEIVNLFYCPSFTKVEITQFSKFFNLDQLKMIEVSAEVFKKICYKDKPDGFLALFKNQEKFLSDIKLKDNSLLVILENVEKPGNLGAIIRTATAAGVQAIIINDNQTDLYNPNVIRASEGNVFSQVLITASVEETTKYLKTNKIKSFGAVTGNYKSYTKVNLVGKIAIVLGSEAQGLSSKWLEVADQLIKIPMLGEIDSLNVSVATAIILFEALRQRDNFEN